MIHVRFEGEPYPGELGLAKGLRGSGDSPGLRRRVGAVLTERAEKIFDISQVLVPVSEEGSHRNPAGFLRDSGGVTPMKIHGNTVQVDIVYTARYAFYVHEDLQVHHKSPTQAKFVERPYLAERRGTVDALKETLAYELRSIAAGALLSKVSAAAK